MRVAQHRRHALQAAADAGDAEAAAALAALPDPAADIEGDEAVQARYAELRADDMRRLAAATANILKLACRFRGEASTPTIVPPAAAADGVQ